MSTITNKLEDAKNALNELSRKHKFKKANASRAEAAELQASLAKCRGTLEVCKKDFSRTIRTQKNSIAEGAAIGADTTIQEQMLWDAAIGYMLVKDAIYALKTISTFDSVSHAYEMLGTAVDLMSERQRILSKLPKLPKLGGNRERNVYGYITSNTALRQKQELLDGFFEELKKTGDIEACLETAVHPAEARASRNLGSLGETDTDLWASVLGAESTTERVEEDVASLDSLMDIHPPVE